ncbi:MAG: DUF3223 domain-containing protein [Bacteroidetes bacterium]|nr:DUF3223 domain-containing protein [Bacteroidota bacterium]
MRKSIKIGDREFKFKKDALLHFKKILNAYDFGESLSGQDLNDMSALVYKAKADDERVKTGIKEIKIGKVQYGTKCFEVIFNNETIDIFSYTLAINGDRKPITKFTNACRNAIQDDLYGVKQKFFDSNSKKGKVKCQETGILSSWTELNVDHRQPNTLSVILDRFIELNNIDLKEIEYEKEDDNKIVLSDKLLEKKFRDYHMEKANLRIVRKENNLGRSHQGRIKKQKKDLRIDE